MKKIILALGLTLGFIHQGTAQNISVQFDTVSALYNGGVLNLHNAITTTSSTPVIVRWSIINHTLPASWINFDLGMCDNQLCYGSNYFNFGNTQIDTVKNSKPIDLKLVINPGAANGSYFVAVNLRDGGNSVNKTVVYVVNKWATNVSSVSKAEDEVALYPNPANDNVNVVFDADLNVKNIAIYNLIGKAVKIYKVNGNSAKLDINDIPSGIYFVRLINTNGQIVATRKFTHQ